MSQLLKPGHNCWKIGDVDSSGLLIDGRNYYKAFFDTTTQAQHSILMAGWQFNSDVRLLRGEDAENCDTDVRLLPHLNQLCEANPNLRVYILAWDYVEFFLLKREWNQTSLFKSKTNHIKFLYDSRHAIGACQHQKMVIVDGQVAFVGGMDICRERWSDRYHRFFRRRFLKSHKIQPHPFHDIQSYHTGPIVRSFVDLFNRAWSRAGGGPIDIPFPSIFPSIKFSPNEPFDARHVAISRTRARTLFPPQRPIAEIRQLYLDAIQSAEKFLYFEQQYFTSRAVFRALLDRFRQKDRPKLQVVLILPREMKTLLEDLALGISQVRILKTLKRIAAQTGHALGIYYTRVPQSSGDEIPTLIHSKLLLVDDKFLTVGSANTANRSMGLDTELNVSWDVGFDNKVQKSLERVRIDLLSEHVGIKREQGESLFINSSNLVSTLDGFAQSHSSTLQFHPMSTRFHWLTALFSRGVTFDPERPLVEEKIYRWFQFRGSHEKIS